MEKSAPRRIGCRLRGPRGRPGGCAAARAGRRSPTAVRCGAGLRRPGELVVGRLRACPGRPPHPPTPSPTRGEGEPELLAPPSPLVGEGGRGGEGALTKGRRARPRDQAAALIFSR